MTLAVLAAYRSYGVGTALLDHIIEYARSLFVHEVYVHVWVENQDAVEWYESRGFKKGQLTKNYYHKLVPRDAWVMSKTF